MLPFAQRQFHDNKVPDLGELLWGVDNIMDQLTGNGVRVMLDIQTERLVAAVDAGQLRIPPLLHFRRSETPPMPCPRVARLDHRSYPAVHV
jgi:hypothetical protein